VGGGEKERGLWSPRLCRVHCWRRIPRSGQGDGEESRAKLDYRPPPYPTPDAGAGARRFSSPVVPINPTSGVDPAPSGGELQPPLFSLSFSGPMSRPPPCPETCVCRSRCRGGRARSLLLLHTYIGKIQPSWSAFWLLQPFIQRVCVRELDALEREAGAQSTTPTHTLGTDSPAREPSWSAFFWHKPSILRVCVRQQDVGGQEGGGGHRT